MGKKKQVMFKTLKPTGTHVITVVKGGLQYFMNNSPQLFVTPLYQLTIHAGAYVMVDVDEEVISINPNTKKGTLIKTVDFLRAKVREGGSGLVEVTQADLRKLKMSTADPKVLSNSYDKLLKGDKELNNLSREKLFEYAEALIPLGFESESVVKNKGNKNYTRKDIISELLKITSKEKEVVETEKEITEPVEAVDSVEVLEPVDPSEPVIAGPIATDGEEKESEEVKK